MKTVGDLTGGFVAMGGDIVERALHSEFLAAVSHRLCNPVGQQNNDLPGFEQDLFWQENRLLEKSPSGGPLLSST